MAKETAAEDEIRNTLEFLQRESHHYDDAMRAVVTRLERLVLFAYTFLVLAATIIIADRHWALALGVPWAAVMLWSLALIALNEIFVLAAARSVIEDQIEVLAGAVQPRIRLIGWERGGAKLTAFSLSQIFSIIVGGGIAVALFVFSYYFAWIKLNQWRPWIVVDIVGFTAVLVLGGIATARVLTVFDRAKCKIELTPSLGTAS